MWESRSRLKSENTGKAVDRVNAAGLRDQLSEGTDCTFAANVSGK